MGRRGEGGIGILRRSEKSRVPSTEILRASDRSCNPVTVHFVCLFSSFDYKHS